MRPISLAVPALGLLTLLAPGPVAAEVRGFRVTTDRTVDSGSLASIVAGAFERSAARTDDERAIALYEYLHATIFHRQYPTEPAPQSVGPLKVIHAYGWSLCGGEHTVLKALFETAGWECRYVGWDGHTTVEVRYGGRWHYFDVFLKCYFWSRDRSHVVSQEEIADDPSIALDAVRDGRAARQHLCCGDPIADVVAGCKGRKVVGDSDGWGSVTGRDRGYSPALRLPAGGSLRLDWKAEPGGFAAEGDPPHHTCGTRDLVDDRVLGPVAEHYGPRSWSDGQFVYAPDFSRPADLADIELDGARARDGRLVATGGAGVATFRLPLPYPSVSARLDADAEGGVTLSVSTDGGATWRKTAPGDITPLVRQRYDVRVKAEFPCALLRLGLDAVVEHNRGALPHLLPGANRVTVATDGGRLPEGTELVVTYAFQEATVPDPAGRSRWDGKGITYGPTRTVTRTVAATPSTFTVEVGGNTPPRMLSLERAVRASASR